MIELPKGIIDTYDDAHRCFSTFYYKPRTHRMVGDQVDESALYFFDIFNRALGHVLVAASSSSLIRRRRQIQRAYDDLTLIIHGCDGNVAPCSFPIGVVVRLPPDIIDLYESLQIAIPNYFEETKDSNLPSLPLFMVALDHLIDAARPGIDRDARIGLLANAKGCLLRIVFHIFEHTVLKMRYEIMSESHGRFAFLWKSSLLAFLWRNSSSTTYINNELLTINHALADGYSLKTKSALSKDCIERVQDAYDTAWKLRERLNRRSLKKILALSIGAAGALIINLVAWAITLLF